MSQHLGSWLLSWAEPRLPAYLPLHIMSEANKRSSYWNAEFYCSSLVVTTYTVAETNSIFCVNEITLFSENEELMDKGMKFEKNEISLK